LASMDAKLSLLSD